MQERGLGRLIGKLKPSQDESELLKYGRPAGCVCYRAHTLLLEQMYQKVGCSSTQLVPYVQQHCAKFTAVCERWGVVGD